MTSKIYVDNNATTPIDPSVVQAVTEELLKGPRNPSSIHFFGQEAKKRLVSSRQTIAQFLGVKASEILFTSGGTESMHLLIRGMQTQGHVITTDLEHPCVYENMKQLPRVSFLSPGLRGAPSPDQIAAAIRRDTSLIVLSAANGETGIKLDLEAVAHVARKANIPLIIDGVALLGKERFTIPSGVTAMGFSGHKIHGPKGIGFVYLRSNTPLSPLFIGGYQEYHFRAGTENLPGIVGLERAISLLEENIERDTAHMKKLRDLLETILFKALPTLKINGTGTRIVNTSNLCFPGIDGESLLIHLDMLGIAASHATACSSGALEVSRVLLNMGIPKSEAHCSLRFSFSRMNTEEEVLKITQSIVAVIKHRKDATISNK